ncbi:MAG: histidinol-phosphatase [Bacteroidia bacterium]|nr:histidinol-phosphatase [Bacteroidia bacterium]
MLRANYHSHSSFCDGQEAPEAYVQAAIAAGFRAWGCSSHGPVPFASAWNMPADRLPAYLAEIRRLQQAYAPQIQVYAGLEADYIPGQASPAALRAQGLDYVIGSVHYVDRDPEGRPWEVDGSHERFLEGLQSIFGGDAQAAVERYFALTRLMVLEDAPDIVGHLDKIKIQGGLFSGREPWYREAVRQVLLAIREQGVAVEVNTRGLYTGKSAELYPAPWILREMLELRIPIVLSSDAHHPAQAGAAFEDALSMLHSIGYASVQILHDGFWQDTALEEWLP